MGPIASKDLSNAPHLLLEAALQHPIRLVQHQQGHPLQGHLALGRWASVIPWGPMAGETMGKMAGKMAGE